MIDRIMLVTMMTTANSVRTLGVWVQVLNRRLITAPQKLVASPADTQAVQTAACACLAAAFGTKVAFSSVANLLCAPLPQAAVMPAAAAPIARQHGLVTSLLELSHSGMYRAGMASIVFFV